MSANVNGDAGGQGISRMHFQRQDATSITVADCNAAMAAWAALWAALKTNVPAGITWTWQPNVLVIEHATAQVQALLTATTPPAPMVGTSASNYVTGTGLRFDWLTQSIHNRRFLRGSNYMIPLGQGAFSTNGNVSSGVVTSATSAANTFLNALNTAQLELIAYHRPPKGTQAGGAAGLVSAVRVPSQPSGLRSRRA
jgi:hypothetical protein